MIPTVSSTGRMAGAVAMIVLLSFAAMAEERDSQSMGIKRKRNIRTVRHVPKERELFVDSEDSWKDLFNSGIMEMSLSMSLSSPTPCPTSNVSTGELYQEVNLMVLNRYCQEVYDSTVSAMRDGGFDWKCQNDDQSIGDSITIADVCARQFSPDHEEVLLGGTADDWACVNWAEARYTIVPVIVVASDFVSDKNAITDAIESVTAAVERVRAWYQRKMSSGKSFRVARPILRLSIHTRTSVYWNELSCLTANPEDRPTECMDKTSPNDRYQYFYEAEWEAQQTSLGCYPRDIIVPVFVYSGPDSDPFWLGAAARGPFSVNPPNVAVCPVEDDDCGLYSIGHEMGHSFGMGHSCDFQEQILPQEPSCSNGMMQNPPDILNAVLFQFEQNILDSSPYFGA